jgi:2-keto-4-pentenoate hydratase/2-oxohepta-3-ene-1,7-dioic acid hydratase in catechol pathway
MRKNLFCVGRNYRDHIIEGNLARGRPADQFPTAIEFFTKPPTAVIGHGERVPRYASLTDSLDYEVELAIVIGRRGRDIARADALDHVFGYTIVNDITARDLQQRCKEKGLPWEIAKAFNGSAPISEFKDKNAYNLNELNFSLTQNDELKQKGNTNMMLFSFDEIIAHISKYFTLKKGDVIFTGTPAGVGKINIGDKLVAYLENEKLLEVEVK